MSRAWGGFFLLLGLVILAAAAAQYGFMTVRQRELRAQAGAAPASATAAAAPPLRLVIPSIHLDDAVVRGVDYEDLLVAPGLLPGSPLPGADGNTVIAGHRDTFFRRVAELKPGARIRLFRAGREFDYRVSSRRIVSPKDTSVLNPGHTPKLTLVTCYPTYWIGPAPKRLIVRASLTGIH
jgi:sortase A